MQSLQQPQRRARSAGVRWAIAMRLALVWCGICAVPSRAHAQGLAGASVRGTITDESGATVADVQVRVLHQRSGVEFRTSSNRAGAYRLDNLPVGSYHLVARTIAADAMATDSVVLHLGDEQIVNFVVRAVGTTVLRPMTIRATPLSLIGAGAASSTLSRREIREIPLLNRNFVGLLSTSPQAVGPGALWISGQHPRLNAIQVDGASASDLFGVNVTPGSGAGGRPISVEALEEVRILVAPFDVRQGGFSGGLINAVTRSGTNTPRGSAFSGFARSELVGADTSGAAVPAFDQLQFGGSLGGPIVRDKLHYFLAGEWQARSGQVSYIPATDAQSVVSEATAERIAAAVRNQFGFDPGDATAPQQRQPNQTWFAKLSWSPSARHSVDVTGTITHAADGTLNRSSTTSSIMDGWQLSNSGSTSRSATRGFRARVLSVFGQFSNEAMIGVRTTRDDVNSRSVGPLFLVGADRPQNYVAAGSVKSAQRTITEQRTVEVTDNLSMRAGNHSITVGTQNLFGRVADSFFLGGWGMWTFGSADSLERALPNYYEVTQPQPGRRDGDVQGNRFSFLSLYAQDQWLPHPRLQLTLGGRMELATFARPQYNAELAANARVGNLNTAQMPIVQPAFSPRFALSWQVRDRQRTQLRAGVGRFTSRTPLAWLGNAYRYTGLEQRTLICDPANGVPAPIADINNLPAQCTTGDGVARPVIASFDRRFRAQQATKYSAGFDHAIGRGVALSLDFLHTKTDHALFVTSSNLVTLGVNGEGRTMYGEPTQRGTGARRLDSTSVDAVYRFANVNGEQSSAVTVALQRRWGEEGVFRVGYQWSRTDDVMSVAGFNGPIILRNNPVDGSLTQRILRRSARDIPHTVVATAVGEITPTVSASLFLRARSGTPYALTTTGDANGDGVQRNDLLYIPRDSADLSLLVPSHYGALNSWIERQPCVRSQRGRIMQRNSCRNPFVTTIDARVAKRLSVGQQRRVELSVDVFNAANLLNRNWGLVRESTATEFLPVLNVARTDVARNRVMYAVPAGIGGQPALPSINRVSLDASRWRAQIGLRFEY